MLDLGSLLCRSVLDGFLFLVALAFQYAGAQRLTARRTGAFGALRRTGAFGALWRTGAFGALLFITLCFVLL